MKRLTMMLPLLALWIMGFGLGSENYVVLENNNLTSGDEVNIAKVSAEKMVGDRIICKKIRLGMTYSKIVLENGEKIKVNTSDIKSYRLNDKLFQKLPLYENGKNTNRMIFMQLVGVKGGYNLFKYSKIEEGINKKTGVYMGVAPVDYYLVFRGDQYSYEVTESNYEDVFKSFGVKMIN